MYIHFMALKTKLLCLEFFLTIIWNVDSRQCRGSFRCCFGYKWNETLQSCIICSVGYTGIDCGMTCPYPYYGEHCQQRCQCTKDRCNNALGCVSSLTKGVSEVEKTPEHDNSALQRNFNVSRVKLAGMTDATSPVERTPENSALDLPANFPVSRVNISGITNGKPPVETTKENITMLKVNLSGNFSDIPESKKIQFSAAIVCSVLLIMLVILLMAIFCVNKALNVRKSNTENSHYTEIPLQRSSHQTKNMIYSKLIKKDEFYTEVE